jgi:hypothetical protein
VINNIDFESRYDRAMYTTPVFGGFRAQVGFGQKSDAGETTEASIWYSGRLAGEIQAAIGWSKERTGSATTEHNETIGGSVAWLHTSGFNLAYNYTSSDLSVSPAREAVYHFFKVGYKMGQHAFSVAYAIGEDQAAADDEADAIALGYTWTPIRWAEIYAGYIIYGLDRTGVDVNDITVAQIGTRIRF